MSLRILSSSDIDTLTSHFQPQDLMLLMAKTFAVFSNANFNAGSKSTSQSNFKTGSSSNSNSGSKSNSTTSVSAPQRVSITTPNHTVLFMPARIQADLTIPTASSTRTTHTTTTTNINTIQNAPAPGHTSIKIVSVPQTSDPRGLPATTVVVDERSGAIKAVVNARKLTALRNAAASLLSTTLTGPAHPRTITAFGAGKQIEAHLELHIRHFPSIHTCTVINRSHNERARSLYSSLKEKYPNILFTLLFSESQSNQTANEAENSNKAIESAVSNADIVMCATSSTKPLFPSSWVRTHTHVILIGSYTPAMREVDSDLVRRARVASPAVSNTSGPLVLVDSREACLKEAGEMIDAGLGSGEMMEIGELVLLGLEDDKEVNGFDGIVKGLKRVDREGFNGPVTIFKSVGVGIQDVAIANAVVEEAEKHGVGVVLHDYDV
ncbi:hypothetical protein CVT24_004959 [Panaeolus cyanescens]|uniref:Ornithine cyclodeaminase n=1 Tax=Panaeolus cyanescens TaxID=181874 RepID=A0A409YB49_9AGAR|nr:hypothetical protein CVT24_004959 [Panaeolus cyanescens]